MYCRDDFQRRHCPLSMADAGKEMSGQSLAPTMTVAKAPLLSFPVPCYCC